MPRSGVARVAMAAALALVIAAPAGAQDRLHLTFAADGTFAPFQSRPAKELMSAEEHAAYLGKLKDQRCEEAESILNAAFVRAYPQFLAARKPADGTYDSAYGDWQLYAATVFDELAYCQAVDSFESAEAELDRSGEARGPFDVGRGDKSPEMEDGPMVRRDKGILYIGSVADNDYVPAYVYMARLVRRGDVLGLGDDFEYYLLARACHLGHPCAPVAPRLAELRQGMAEERAQELARLARAELPSVNRSVRAGKVVEPKSRFETAK